MGQRNRGMWANGMGPIAPASRIRIPTRQQHFEDNYGGGQDDAPPMGMPRPQIPAHLKAPVYNEPDPAGGMARPQLPEHLRNLQQGK
jgi:hypothetical protein